MSDRSKCVGVIFTVKKNILPVGLSAMSGTTCKSVSRSFTLSIFAYLISR